MRFILADMIEDISTTGPSAVSANVSSTPATPVAAALDPVTVFAMLGSELRWQMVRRLAGGEARSASDLAAELGRDFDGVSKHLRLMREAGVLASQPGADRRHTHYFIPAEFRREAGFLDFGVCRVRVD